MDRNRHNETRALVCICLLSLLVRAATAFLFPTVVHPDETFQYLEQAYRLATGRGLVPWEYVVGARSWMLPGFFAIIFKAAMSVSSAPAFYLGCATAIMIAIATAGVAAAFRLGLRAGGLAHAVCAGLLAAIWCELVFLSPHVLADTVSATTLICAFALSYKKQRPGAATFVAAGLLFGLTFVLRLQLAPAIAVALLSICGLRFKSRYLPMACGFAIALALFGITDWIALGTPFRSAYVYLKVNSGGVADAFGTAPFYAYGFTELMIWGASAPLIVVTAYLGGKRLPLLALVAAIIVLTFSLVGHKEYRFIYPALPLLFVLCGVGTVDLIADFERWRQARGLSRPSIGRYVPGEPAGIGPALSSHTEAGAGRSQTPAPAPAASVYPWIAAAIVWTAASLVSALWLPLRDRWVRDAPVLRDIAQINGDRAACGVGVDPPSSWYLLGMVRMRTDIPLYDGDAVGADASRRAYNYILSFDPENGESDPEAPHPDRTREGYTTIRCDTGRHPVCLLKREGSCDPAAGTVLKADPDDDVRDVLVRLGFWQP